MEGGRGGMEGGWEGEEEWRGNHQVHVLFRVYTEQYLFYRE